MAQALPPDQALPTNKHDSAQEPLRLQPTVEDELESALSKGQALEAPKQDAPGLSAGEAQARKRKGDYEWAVRG